MRGILTKEIETKAIEILKVKNFTQRELRLMAYMQYVMVNDQKIDIRKITKEEREILSKWRAHKWIEGGASGLAITKEFWDAMSEILWLGYVAYNDAP